MKPSYLTDNTPLRTDDDVLRRVEQQVGPAAVDRRLWLMWVDGDGRQAPVVMPVDDIPRSPEPTMLDGLGQVLAGLRAELRTDLGPGSVILTLERLGADAAQPADRNWADALGRVCEHVQAPLRGVFLSTRGGVRRLR